MLIDTPRRHTVAGNHQTVVREPNTRAWAGLLRAQIDDARRAAP